MVCSFCEIMAGSLSVASTVVLSGVTVVDCGEVVMPAVYSRYNNYPRTRPCLRPLLTDLERVIYTQF
jgi:hypothetical protein